MKHILSDGNVRIDSESTLCQGTSSGSSDETESEYAISADENENAQNATSALEINCLLTKKQKATTNTLLYRDPTTVLDVCRVG